MSLEEYILAPIKSKINPEKHENLRRDLRKNRVAYSVRTHVARSILYPLLIVCFSIPLLYFILSASLNISQILVISTSILSGSVLGFSANRLILAYPSLKLSNRKKEIEDMLPHAAAYMLALSKGGYESIEIFESLSKQKEYGEIAKEASAIYRNSKLLGYNPTEAIEQAAETSPSPKFKDFLNSFVSVMQTGSNMVGFLSRKCDQFYDEAEEEQEEELEFLGVLSEAYVASVGLGPIFGIVLLILFAMMEQFQTSILYIIIYLLIPFGTALFILLLDMQARTTIAERSDVINPAKNGISNNRTLKDGMRNPKKVLKENFKTLVMEPEKIFAVSLPVAIVVAIILMLQGALIETIIVFSLLASLAPLAVFHELKQRREYSMVKTMPNFLDSLSSSLNSGLSPVKSIIGMSPKRYPGLKWELERIHSELEWGQPVAETLQKSAKRIRSGLISRTMLLIKKSSEVAADLGEILTVLSRDVNMERNLVEERKRITSTYVLIIILTFGIFLLTSYSIASAFIPLLAQTGEVPAETDIEGMQIGGADPEVIKMTFFRASLLQGFFSGLLAGKMREEKILSGLKYSLILVSIAWIFFIVTIV
ncbi:MAG: type II secretion system F family protein [Candidatus Hadarchaeota archaeon]